MDRVSVSCVLLLLCFVSGAELQDSEIKQRTVSDENVNVQEQPQLCPSNFYAVVQEISAKLTENSLRIQQLQRLNEEQASKLEELQSREVDPIKEQLRVGQVAFSASLLASGAETMGPFQKETHLIFRNVFSNVGNAYNVNTGFFTAPVRGAYHFTFYAGAGGGSNSLAVVLRKNSELIVSAWEHQTNGQSKASNGVTLVLEAGDVVGVHLWPNQIIYDNQHRHSTFSGHMLFPMVTP